MPHPPDFRQWFAHADIHTRAELWTPNDPRVPTLAVDWLGMRSWWWSRPIPAGQRLAVVSSRLPRLVDPRGPWLQAVRAALERASVLNAVLVVASGTAGSELILRGATRRALLTICIRCCELKRKSAQAWAREWAARQQNSSGVSFVEAWAFPQLHEPSDPFQEVPPDMNKIPERDRAAIAWSDEVIVLSLRTGGNLHSLLRHRIRRQDSRVLLADLPRLQSPRARDELLKLGAALWRPEEPMIPQQTRFPHVSAPAQDPLSTCDRPSTIRNPQTPPLTPSAACWDYLTHTTRACVGPWPGQSREDYLDSLLDARPDADHSAFGALLRIVSERRLLASGRTIRGGHRVVSFTAVPISELPRLRVFRSHRSRWDFEPYGICIRRRWLEERRAKPVLYGNEAVWNYLPDPDQPFFQLVRDTTGEDERSSRKSSGIDWSIEQEWRHVGNLDLSQLPREDILLFVPTPEEARILLESSPWPVTVL